MINPFAIEKAILTRLQEVRLSVQTVRNALLEDLAYLA